MKKETVNEAAADFVRNKDTISLRSAFMKGATWQKEQDSKVMYTEEEGNKLCFSAAIYAQEHHMEYPYTYIKEWFEIHKKK